LVPALVLSRAGAVGKRGAPGAFSTTQEQGVATASGASGTFVPLAGYNAPMRYQHHSFATDRRGERTPGLARLGTALVLSLLAACGQFVELGESLRPMTPHEQYSESLRRAGLEKTALGRDWLAAAEQVLRKPVTAPLPFRETSYFPADEAHAVGYLIRAQRGQRLTVRVELHGEAEPARLFVDLFELPADTARPPIHRSSAPASDLALNWEPRRDSDYLIRVQPELLRSLSFTIRVQSEAALAFPVVGRDSRAVGSGFGAPRDGGRREHHGIDIFAPRGTPVIAATAGTVTRVNETPRGGRVIWLRDAARGQNLYYAHLDSQRVEEGAAVMTGDTLGTVGNTGNARSTPPHLHFGIYRRGEGPIDPHPWVHTSPLPLPAANPPAAGFGSLARIAGREVALRAAPAESGASLATLPYQTAMRLVGASGAYFRVLLPDGHSGYVEERAVEAADRLLRRQVLPASVALQERPVSGAAVIDSLAAAAEVGVLGRFGTYLLVQAPPGGRGWVAE
jgi:peptidoglycan LD-endopeptidase LytH